MALVIREVFHLPLRAVEGFLRSIVQLMGLEDVSVPDYTTLCRRQKRLQVTIPRLSCGEPVHLAIDSSGLKIHGEGEWHHKVHGAGRWRSWRKLHIGVGHDTRQCHKAIPDRKATALIPSREGAVEWEPPPPERRWSRRFGNWEGKS